MGIIILDQLTTDEKINLVISFDDIQELSSGHFKILKTFSVDGDDFLRSLCAEQFSKFHNDIAAMDLLLEMANDKDELVRMCAYDSLSKFEDDVVEKTLKNAILKDKDDLARSHAILNWVEVVYEMENNADECLKFMQSQKNNEIAENCLLSYSYGFYLLDKNKEVEELLAYLSSEDDQIRIAVINLLDDMEFDSKQKEKIRRSIIDLVPKEESVGVMRFAMKLLDDISDMNDFIGKHNIVYLE